MHHVKIPRARRPEHRCRLRRARAVPSAGAASAAQCLPLVPRLPSENGDARCARSVGSRGRLMCVNVPMWIEDGIGLLICER